MKTDKLIFDFFYKLLGDLGIAVPQWRMWVLHGVSEMYDVVEESSELLLNITEGQIQDSGSRLGDSGSHLGIQGALLGT